MFKKWKFQGGGGDLPEIPSVVGVWIFSGTTHCYARKIGVIFFLFQFKSMKLEYCNKGPPVKDANKYIFNITVIKSQFIGKTLRF